MSAIVSKWNFSDNEITKFMNSDNNTKQILLLNLHLISDLIITKHNLIITINPNRHWKDLFS